ncbi:hypothetical protein [Phocaeicola salanitronis]|uniref:hypothetical protein n=1 Tax=Phocaeicola salanitronis TaxID=376805 RepID=UPI00117C52BD|nr:hypothetical protein [Phocaeicola salanitronis]
MAPEGEHLRIIPSPFPSSNNLDGDGAIRRMWLDMCGSTPSGSVEERRGDYPQVFPSGATSG